MKRNKFQSGQSLVEVAILFPVVIFLLTGFFDLGRAIFYYSSLTNMVREGALYG
jgi:Flp pilus assembly protein TadG